MRRVSIRRLEPYALADMADAIGNTKLPRGEGVRPGGPYMIELLFEGRRSSIALRSPLRSRATSVVSSRLTRRA